MKQNPNLGVPILIMALHVHLLFVYVSMVQAYFHGIITFTRFNPSLAYHMIISSCLIQVHVLLRPTSYGHLKYLVHALLLHLVTVFQAHLSPLSYHFSLVHESFLKPYFTVHLCFIHFVSMVSFIFHWSIATLSSSMLRTIHHFHWFNFWSTHNHLCLLIVSFNIC